MMVDPREKLHVIIRQYDKDGCDSLVCEYETVTLGKLLEHIYAFSLGRHDHAVRMTVDIAYPFSAKPEVIIREYIDEHQTLPDVPGQSK